MIGRKSSLVTVDFWSRAKWDGDTVPAIKLSHLTESQRMAFLIADNRLTENSSWDERMLGEQLKILSRLSRLFFSL